VEYLFYYIALLKPNKPLQVCDKPTKMLLSRIENQS
jgi:hypothetical protein